MAPTLISVEERREQMALAEADGVQYIGRCPDDLDEKWIDVPLPDGQTNRTKVVWPKSSAANPLRCPLIVYIHGGGFITGTPDLVLAPARGFASMFSAVVACPSLNQLPEQPFPAPIKIAWEVCSWLSDANNLNNGVLRQDGTTVDLDRGFIVGGLSAGGTASAVIGGIFGSTAAKLSTFSNLTSLQHPITGIFCNLPMLVTDAMVPKHYEQDFKSRIENADPDGFNITQIRELEKLIGDFVHTPWFSPINLDTSDPSSTQNHPKKVFIYCGGLDPFRDDAIVYHKWLSALPGVESRLSVLENSNHVAWATPAYPAYHTREVKEVALDGMSWLLGKKWDSSGKDLPI
ncbi:unnamed protein product [Clonostachys solani]|uniref:Alpha/beta hydrolase fold-3 domain-containing protein n=1 Tax=Clonostachys solani TaxID=160281 RepID=A0A9P0EPH2_9HYPO|nr:unnamed protein product [Clonostachys solani]